MQVVTSENVMQLHETGKVDAYKPPESKAAETKKELPARNADGSFTKLPDGDTTTPAGATPEKNESDEYPEHVRKVIGKKHREMKEAEEFGKRSYLERIAAETRAEKAERELAEIKAKSRPVQQSEDKPPKAEDFATVAEFTEALTDYKVAKKFEAEKARQEKERQDAEKATREREFNARVAAAKTEFDDFDDVMGSIAGTEMDRVHGDVIEYLQESEHGARLMYTLAKTPETLDRLRKLSPRRFIAELGKLETKWDKQPEKTASLSDVAASSAAAPAVSKAPAPIQPLDGKGSAVEKDPAKMTFQELREHNRKREAEKRARR